MKGYSFQELVKLAEAAVKRAGDTMAGDLTAPKFLMSAAQSTAVNASTRKDYVDSAIAAGDALQVSKTGDTMTGALTTQSTTGNWRIAPTAAGSYGSFWHQDPNHLYLMLTDINSQTSSYNSLRPFKVALSTGLVAMENGLLLTAAQGTSSGSATRKDYVDSAIAAGDALQVSKSGDTMTGNLTAPAVLVSATQNTSVNALTRKDYVDSTIAAGDALQVSKTGDTMTGNLTAPKFIISAAQGNGGSDAVRYDYLNSQTPVRSTRIPSGADLNTYQTPGFYHQALDSDAVAGSNYPEGIAGALLVQIAAGVIQTYHVYGTSRIWTRGLYSGTWSAWAREYNTLNKPTPADIGAVAVSGTAVDQPITLRLAQGIYTGSPSAPLEMGHGAASSGNFYIDIHTTAPAIDYDYRWAYYTGGDGVHFNSRIAAAALEVTSQGPGASSVARKDYVDDQIAKQVSKSGDTMTGNLFAPAVLVSSAQNASGGALTRKDYVDSQVATRAPTTHSHTAAQGNADIVASGWGQVGSYAMACCIANVGAKSAGFVIAGSSLKLACGSDQWAGRGATLPGTWKLLGYIVGDGEEGGWNNSTWIRIS